MPMEVAQLAGEGAFISGVAGTMISMTLIVRTCLLTACLHCLCVAGGTRVQCMSASASACKLRKNLLMKYWRDSVMGP
jgi:hypothetical protein